MRKYRVSSRREQERLRRSLEQQASWAREQQRLADEQRQALERSLAEQRRKAIKDASDPNAPALATSESIVDLFSQEETLGTREKRSLRSDFSEQFFFYSINFSGLEVPPCVVFVYSDVRDSTTCETLNQEVQGLKSFVTAKEECYLHLDDKPVAQYMPVQFPVVLILGLSLGKHNFRIRQQRIPLLFASELNLPFELECPGTYAVQMISRFYDDRRRSFFGNKFFEVYQPKIRRID
jgi:hypothetical protein